MKKLLSVILLFIFIMLLSIWIADANAGMTIPIITPSKLYSWFPKIAQEQGAIFLKNPKDGNPQIVVVTLIQFGLIARMAYIQNGILFAYKIDNINNEIKFDIDTPLDIRDWLKKRLLFYMED